MAIGSSISRTNSENHTPKLNSQLRSGCEHTMMQWTGGESLLGARSSALQVAVSKEWRGHALIRPDNPDPNDPLLNMGEVLTFSIRCSSLLWWPCCGRQEPKHSETLVFSVWTYETLPGRLELPTLRLTASRSDQLSYGSLCHHILTQDSEP